MGGCLIQEGRSSGHKACHGARPHAAASPRPWAPRPRGKKPPGRCLTLDPSGVGQDIM